MDCKQIKPQSLLLDNKYVWIGTEGGGLCLLNKKTGHITHYKNEPNSPLSISDNNILTMTKGFNDKVLIGTNNGLNIATINDDGLSFTTVKNHNGTQHNRFNVVSAIFPASENELWFGSQGNGLFRINVENGDTIINHYENNDYDRTSIPSNIVNSILSDRTGSIWIGTQDGISHFDPIKLGFQHYTYKYGDENSLNEKNVWSIYEGMMKLCGLAREKVVSRINLKKNQYNHYLYKTDNLNEPNNNNVYSITSDNLEEYGQVLQAGYIYWKLLLIFLLESLKKFHLEIKLRNKMMTASITYILKMTLLYGLLVEKELLK